MLSILIQIGLLFVGFLLLIKGADAFVDGAASVANRFGIPQLIIGLTIVACGTSLPEAAVSISAALKGSADISIGNVLGSNIMNVLLILGITAVICAIPVKKSTTRTEIPFVIGITVFLMGIGLWDNTVSRAEGIVLLLFLIAYLAYLFRAARHSQEEEAQTTEAKLPLWRMVLMIVIGVACIIFGSDLAVDAATSLAVSFGMSERFIGLTIVALGTSLPELVTSATAAMKGKTDIAMGNIVGSNIFNVLFIVGLTALVIPVPYGSEFFIDSLVALFAVVLLLLLVARKGKLTRVGGIAMLACYAAYFVYLLL